MKKQVILTTEEYNRLIQIAGIAAQVVDKYILKSSEKFSGEEHIMDSPKRRDENLHNLYLKLLYMGEMTQDVLKVLPRNYLQTEQGKVSVFSEDSEDF